MVIGGLGFDEPGAVSILTAMVDIWLTSTIELTD